MAKTIQTMITRIASELRRPQLALPADMTSPIAVAILTAIEFWQKDRFRISDSNFTTNHFPTQAGVYIYGTLNGVLWTIFQIDYLDVMVGSTLEKMTKRTANEIHLLNQQNQQSGQPTDWAYEGNQVLLYPIPSGAWEIYIGGHVVVAAPATLAEDNNPWMNWGEQLIRCQAKYEIATHITRNPTMAQAMSPDSAGGPNGQPGETWRAWQRLKRETNKIKSVGRVRAMQF